MRRGYLAAVDGPITIDAGLFTQAGWIKVQVRDDCTRARVGFSTDEEQGPAADAVRDAVAESGPDGRLLTTIYGSPDAAPLEITVVAPPGSSLVARTDQAHIGAIGLTDVELTTKSGEISVPVAARVFAETASGNISIQRATEVTATSQSGTITIGTSNRATVRTTSSDIRLGNTTGDVTAKSISGNLTLHATADATIRATTVSGDLTITADPTVKLNLNTSTATGRVTVP